MFNKYIALGSFLAVACVLLGGCTPDKNSPQAEAVVTYIGQDMRGYMLFSIVNEGEVPASVSLKLAVMMEKAQWWI